VDSPGTAAIDDTSFLGYNLGGKKPGTQAVAGVSRGKGGGKLLIEVRVGKGETLDSALKRFKRTLQKDGVLAEVRKREHYLPPSVKRKKKSAAARRRRGR